MPHTLNIDGGSRGNPGPAACGVVVCENKAVVFEAGFFLGRATNNVAEYQGLIRGVRAALDIGIRDLTIYSDSELMVRQITGEYRVKSPDLKPLFDEAQVLLRKLASWKFSHIYRESNSRADAVANMAMDKKQDVILIADGKPNTALPPSPITPAVPAEAKWNAVFCAHSGRNCPAPCKKGQSFEVGQTTPRGLCIFAAVPILTAIITDGEDTVDNESPLCMRCGVEIKVQRAN